jgi:hypothetical protein
MIAWNRGKATDLQNRGIEYGRRKTWLILFRDAQLADVSLVPIAVGCKDGGGE